MDTRIGWCSSIVASQALRRKPYVQLQPLLLSSLFMAAFSVVVF
jgi:hypothetical protein